MHKEGLVNAWEGLHNLAIECETEEDLFNSNFRQKGKDSWNLSCISRKVFLKNNPEHILKYNDIQQIK